MSFLFFRRQKRNNCPKKYEKRSKSIDASTKSTRFESKNIVAVDEKIEQSKEKDVYFDLTKNVRASIQNDFLEKSKENINNNIRDENINFENIFSTKNYKVSGITNKNIKTIKLYKEDKKEFKFPLYNEKDIKIDKFDNKVYIESEEEDYSSDDNTINHGTNLVEKHLKEAFSEIKEDSLHCIGNYKKYNKYMKKPNGNLNIKKNLPINRLKVWRYPKK